MTTPTHHPVMLTEVIDALNVRYGETYVDATLGGGGHAQAMIDAGAKVIGFDHDPEAIKVARSSITSSDLTVINDNFIHLSDRVRRTTQVDIYGVLYDLGTSAFQLAGQDRGFSFIRDEPLDMRMDPTLTVTAADLIQALSEKELVLLFTKYSQESYARPIAKNIVAKRHVTPITTTGQLCDVIAEVKPERGHLHPATKVFQSLRIAVNDELNNLKDSLPQAVALLALQGRLVVISFHEGEDRIVKNFIASSPNLKNLTHKPLTPTTQETNNNPRSRSAKLRIAEKCTTE